MKKFGKSVAIASALGLSAMFASSVAFAANSQRFESSIQAPAGAVTVNVTLSEDLAYRAENMSKNLRDRSRSRGLRDGFASRSLYGQRDLDRLTERLKRKTEERLMKEGVEISDTGATVLNLVIVDADPNRPTFRQLANSASQSFKSFGVGGASFEGTMTRAGENVGTVSYAWFENDIRDAQYSSTWSDANRAIDRFARKTAKSLR